MDIDLDKKLYNDYLNGKIEAFESLYFKYKDKIRYFVFSIVKDYEKAEDITQEVFVDILKNKFRKDESFKYYIYLVAKSKALNYIGTEKRRKDISEKYLENAESDNEKDALEIIVKNEEKKELLEAITLLDEKYKKVMYLVKIEEFSYKETGEILNLSEQDVKNHIHRGKKELRKILLKKGFNDMNKISKFVIILLATSIVLTGTAYAVNKIYKSFNKNNNITFNPSYQSTLDENTINNLWIGTLDLAWKDLAEKVGGKIELEENVDIANELNQSKFSKEMLSNKDYIIDVERTLTGGYKIEATLNKELNFLHIFDNFSNYYKYTFGKENEEYIKYFGINNATSEKINENVEILFYNKISNNAANNDFAVKLKTKEGDEIILYRTDENKTFDEYYKDIERKTSEYTEDRTMQKEDQLLVPYVRVNGMISYNELYGKTIKDTNMYISDVVQNVNFSLNEKGCNLSSKATVVAECLSVSDSRYCWFKDTFIIFMKEKDKEMPYFALKVDNSDILVKVEDTDEPILLDSTMRDDFDNSIVEEGQYKFYEDENYEYYYPTQKTKYVHVYFNNGDFLTAEEALKQGKITLDLLDKYEVEYIKKEK